MGWLVGSSGGGGGSGDVLSSGNNNLSGRNLFLLNTAETTVPTSNGSSSIILSAYDGLGGAGNNDYDLPLQVWSYYINTHPMIYFNAQGSIVCGGSILISNDFVGTLGVNQKAIGPFESTTDPGTALLGCMTFMKGVRSDVLGATVQIGSVTSNISWTGNAYPFLIGESKALPNQADSKAYSIVLSNGGICWSYSGLTCAQVQDASITANLGVSRIPNDIMDYGLIPTNSNYLSLELANQASANADSISKGYSSVHLQLTNGSLVTVGDISVAQLATPAAPTLTKNGSHTAGATTYTYAIVARSANGQTLASTTASVTNCLATLDASNTISIDIAAVNGAISYDIYRTAGGGSTGLIDTIAANNSALVLSGVGLSTVYRRIDDGSFAGSSETLPTSANGYRNTTGGILCGGTLVCQSSGNAGFLTAWRIQNVGGATFDFFEHNGSTDPAAPGSNFMRVYSRDDGTGKTQLCVRPGSGDVQILAIQDRTQTFPAGILSINSTSVANSGTTGPDDLISYTLPANALNTNGRTLRIRATGSIASNGNTKVLQMAFGSATVLNQTFTTSIAGRWEVEILIHRTGSNAQDYVSKLTECLATLGTPKIAIEIGTATQTDSATITIKGVASQASGTSTNDIVMENLIVELLN